MSSIRICAVGDIHGMRYFSVFQASLRSIVGFHPHVCVLAGDIIDEGKVEELEPVLDAIRDRYPKIPVVGVFGNEEYHEVEPLIIKKYPEVIWLNDSLAILTLNKVKVGFVGTRGSLEKLTYWQKRHMPELMDIYSERPRIIKELIGEVKKYSDIVILISHYAPTFLTVKGESRKLYPYMGSREMEKAVREAKPDLVIHAHAHNARVTEATIDMTRIFNVSLPARKGIAQIEVRPRIHIRIPVGTTSGTADRV